MSARMLPEKKFFRRINVIPPVQSPLAKINPFALPPNHFHNFRHPVPLEGRFAIVTDVGAGCGGHGGTLTNGADVDGEVVWS
jgi:hypothetical protein